MAPGSQISTPPLASGNSTQPMVLAVIGHSTVGSGCPYPWPSRKFLILPAQPANIHEPPMPQEPLGGIEPDPSIMPTIASRSGMYAQTPVVWPEGATWSECHTPLFWSTNHRFCVRVTDRRLVRLAAERLMVAAPDAVDIAAAHVHRFVVAVDFRRVAASRNGGPAIERNRSTRAVPRSGRGRLTDAGHARTDRATSRRRTALPLPNLPKLSALSSSIGSSQIQYKRENLFELPGTFQNKAFADKSPRRDAASRGAPHFTAISAPSAFPHRAAIAPSSRLSPRNMPNPGQYRPQR